MADLLTHVLVGLILAVMLSWRFAWITPPMLAAAMVGATLPDLNRIELVLPASTVESVIGLPWSWTGFHRLGGTLLVILIIVLVVDHRYRKSVLLMLILGAASHYTLDLLLWQPTGQATPMLWPILDWQASIDGWYRSMDRWPLLLTLFVSTVVLLIDRSNVTHNARREQD